MRTQTELYPPCRNRAATSGAVGSLQHRTGPGQWPSVPAVPSAHPAEGCSDGPAVIAENGATPRAPANPDQKNSVGKEAAPDPAAEPPEYP